MMFICCCGGVSLGRLGVKIVFVVFEFLVSGLFVKIFFVCV